MKAIKIDKEWVYIRTDLGSVIARLLSDSSGIKREILSQYDSFCSSKNWHINFVRVKYNNFTENYIDYKYIVIFNLSRVDRQQQYDEKFDLKSICVPVLKNIIYKHILLPRKGLINQHKLKLDV